MQNFLKPIFLLIFKILNRAILRSYAITLLRFHFLMQFFDTDNVFIFSSEAEFFEEKDSL